MTAVTAPNAGPIAVVHRAARIDIVVPVFNEQVVLARSIRHLHAYLLTQFDHDWRIVIVDNASIDATPRIADRLARTLPRVEVIHLSEKGRGRALRTAWQASDAEVVAYMDVDLSTDLRALAPLVAPLLSGHSEIAIGTRLASGSRVTRGPRRELISRAYMRILRVSLRARFSDAQCGFKALSADAARTLLPEVVDQEWFFDTELLIAAQRRRMRIHEVAVDWVDDPDSRVRILATALADLRGVLRLRFARRVHASSRSRGEPDHALAGRAGRGSALIKRDRGHDRAALEQVGALHLAGSVAQTPAVHERRGPATVEVQGIGRTQLHQRSGELAERHAGVAR